MLIPEIKTEIQKRKVSDIVFKEEIYARFEVDNDLISTYEQNIETILKANSYIDISQGNILIDGYHRLKAIERVYGKDFEFDCRVHLTDNLDYIELESYAANQKHGKRNSRAETARNIQRLYMKGHDIETIMDKLSLAKSIVYEATKIQREIKKSEMEREAIQMYLRAWNSYDDISSTLGMSKGNISNIVDSFKNSTCGRFEHTFEPFMYDVWMVSNDVKIGCFPQLCMENFLWFHTEPLDIVYDPFADNSTTIDGCKKMCRRYYCSNFKVKPGLEKEVRQWDIRNGLPDDLKKPDIAFINPSFWFHAKDEQFMESIIKGYHPDKECDDLGTDYNGFLEMMGKLFIELARKKTKRIAYYCHDFYSMDKNGKWKSFSPIWDLYQFINKSYKSEMRYVIIYDERQYTEEIIREAQKQKKCLILFGDLVIMKLKENG